MENSEAAHIQCIDRPEEHDSIQMVRKASSTGVRKLGAHMQHHVNSYTTKINSKWIKYCNADLKL